MKMPSTFRARDGHTYYRTPYSRVMIKDQEGLSVGEKLIEYWITHDDDSRRCYVAEDGIRHILD